MREEYKKNEIMTKRMKELVGLVDRKSFIFVDNY